MKHNKSLRTAERHLKKYSKTMQIAARHTDLALEDYEILTQFCLEQERFKRICSHSAGLLRRLGVDPFQSEKKLSEELGLYENSESTVHLLLALRYLAKPGLSRRKILDYYKEVRSHLQGV